MAGNGIFAGGLYAPTSIETWDDYTGATDWDAVTTWAGTPSLPLTYTTAIIDTGRIDQWLPLTTVNKQGQLSTTIYYGNTIDSSGGAIDSASSVTYTAGDSVSAIKARYFQFLFSVDYADSSGVEPTPTISSIQTDMNTEKEFASFDSIDSSTLGGSLGARQLVVDQPITPTTVTIQPHIPGSDPYVASGYVDGGYVTTTATSRPVVYINKSSTPIVLNIYELDTFGKTKTIDCTFDAIIQGLPNATVDAAGNIVRG